MCLNTWKYICNTTGSPRILKHVIVGTGYYKAIVDEFLLHRGIRYNLLDRQEFSVLSKAQTFLGNSAVHPVC